MRTINLQNLEHLSKHELIEIYDNLNNWIWDDRIGEKPNYWDEIPKYSTNKYQITKYTTIKPYMHYIQSKISLKEYLRYHHIHNLKRKWWQFEIWWFMQRWIFRDML